MRSGLPQSIDAQISNTAAVDGLETVTVDELTITWANSDNGTFVLIRDDGVDRRHSVVGRQPHGQAPRGRGGVTQA